jgi:hypothetical protein
MCDCQALHKNIVAQLKARAKLAATQDGLAYSFLDKADRIELVQAIVHAADLSAQSMPACVAYKFGRGVLEEFHNQYLRERREKLPESLFMKDLHQPLAQAKAQLGFLQYVVGPLWEAFSKVNITCPKTQIRWLLSLSMQ